MVRPHGGPDFVFNLHVGDLDHFVGQNLAKAVTCIINYTPSPTGYYQPIHAGQDGVFGRILEDG